MSLSRTPRGIPPVGGDHSQYVETDYGIADSRPNGGHNIFYLPNINQIRTRVRVPGYERLPEYRMVWHVPVDDTHTVSFDVNIVPGLAGREAEAFRRKRELHEGDGASPYELAEAILAGKKRVEDMDASLPIYMQFWVEDYVTMVGQGIAPDFDAEHLGKNDVKVILRRRIFAREMQALAAGKPLKQWTSPALYTDPE